VFRLKFWLGFINVIIDDTFKQFHDQQRYNELVLNKMAISGI